MVRKEGKVNKDSREVKKHWIRNRPESERPREKLLTFGPESLSNAELLAIALRTGVAGKSAIQLAGDILDDFGGLRGLFAASTEDLSKTKGLKTAKIAQLKAALELSKRFLQEDLKQKPILESSQEVFDYLYQSMRDLDAEVFKVILLNGQNQIMDIADVFRGSVDSSSIYPREVIKLALKYSAPAVVFVHNHPSGSHKPSEGDKEMTKNLVLACMTTGIKVHDHIIIGNNQYYSFADNELIQAYESDFERMMAS
ncbi:MAG: RadC family protein [Chloroflexota bacterium]